MLADDLGANERTLRRAVRAGAIHARRPSPRTVRLAAGEPEYLRRHWPLLAGLRAVLRTEHNVALAVLFGSLARGSEHEGSDLDVLVVLYDPSPHRVAGLELKLTRAAGREANVILVDRALREAPQFVLAALDEGRVLTDRDGHWPELRRRRPQLERRMRERRRRDGRAAFESLALLEALE
jgi:predicted nucleotidyltransferase